MYDIYTFFRCSFTFCDFAWINNKISTFAKDILWNVTFAKDIHRIIRLRMLDLGHSKLAAANPQRE